MPINKMNEAEYDVKNCADRGLEDVMAEVDNSLLDIYNSSPYKKVEFNNCLVFIKNHSEFLTTLLLIGELHARASGAP